MPPVPGSDPAFHSFAGTIVHEYARNVRTVRERPKLSRFRQQIMILHLSNPDLDSSTVAWASWDGAAPADKLQMQTGDQEKPPYRSVLDAMRDGWFVIQFPPLARFFHGEEHETGHLPYEYVLERRVEIDG